MITLAGIMVEVFLRRLLVSSLEEESESTTGVEDYHGAYRAGAKAALVP
jgi:hypothetical protein